MLLEPGCEALVQLGAGRLSVAPRRRRRGSGCGGSGSRPRPRAAARSGLISSLRTSAASRGVTWVSSGASAWTAPRWKISPSIAPRSSTLRSAGSSWSRRAASSACSVGGTTTSPSRLAGHRQHLLDEERVAARGRARSARAARRRACAGMSSSTSSSPSGSRRSVTGQVGCRSTSSGRAMQSSRIDAPEESSATCSIRSRKRLLAPLDVVEDDDQRSLGRRMLQRLAERPGDLLGRWSPRRSRRAASGSPPQRPRPPAARRAASAPRRPAST